MGWAADPSPIQQAVNTWVKRSPSKNGPVSPGMGYETSLAYDPQSRLVIRWGGHNQGGGGEQNAETWVFDPVTTRWTLKEPNTSPPGVCCAQQNVFDPITNRFVRFPAFSGSHGWQWFREVYLNNSTVWTYDLARNTWRDMRPVPAPRVSPLRCASWDSDMHVAVLFGGEGNEEGTVVYDPNSNTWTKMRCKNQPSFRSGGNMIYDSGHQLHILFGSQFSDDPHTWAYDLRKNEWRDMKPPVQPPTNRNDAVSAYDPVNQVVIAVVRVVDKQEKEEIIQGHLETWTFDAGKNTWTWMKPPREPDGFRSRRRVMTAVPDYNLILMENFANASDRIPDVDREQQMWTYRYAEAKINLPGKTKESAENKKDLTKPPLVEDAVLCVVGPKEVQLSWTPPSGKNIAGYHVERALVEVFSEAQIIRLKTDTVPLAEPSVGAIKAIGPFTRMTKEPVKEPRFTDTSLNLANPMAIGGENLFVHRFRNDQIDPKGKPYRYSVYAYRVRAVNALGMEGGPSPYFLTIPSAPQWVFSKEVEDQCHLKWTANLEKGLKGYRVYRMESPRKNGPGQPVTRVSYDPVAECRYIDSNAGKATRRYWIVAVDALGQEGFPSAPVWHYREYRRHYAPFVGEWHQ